MFISIFNFIKTTNVLYFLCWWIVLDLNSQLESEVAMGVFEKMK